MSQNSSLENIISEISLEIEPIFWQSHQPANSFSMEHIENMEHMEHWHGHGATIKSQHQSACKFSHPFASKIMVSPNLGRFSITVAEAKGPDVAQKTQIKFFPYHTAVWQSPF